MLRAALCVPARWKEKKRKEKKKSHKALKASVFLWVYLNLKGFLFRILIYSDLFLSFPLTHKLLEFFFFFNYIQPGFIEMEDSTTLCRSAQCRLLSRTYWNLCVSKVNIDLILIYWFKILLFMVLCENRSCSTHGLTLLQYEFTKIPRRLWKWHCGEFRSWVCSFWKCE